MERDYRSERGDYRSSPMERWRATGVWEPSVFPEVNKLRAQHLKEESELIGFYVAWHTYGGFEKLEQAGWHRATIHRKIRRFRNRYGKHPDDYRFSWLKLNLEQHWNEEIDHDLHGPLGEP
jgi:hypothetical protein